MMWACGEGKAAPRRADGVGLVRVRVRWSAHGSPSRSAAEWRNPKMHLEDWWRAASWGTTPRGGQYRVVRSLAACSLPPLE
jgi:hypothetical protein